jgi:hypothetical protein
MAINKKLNIKPVEIQGDVDRISFTDEFGDTALIEATAHIPKSASPTAEMGLQAIIEGAKEIIRERKQEALSRVDILKEQTDSLGDCVTIASQIYMNAPIPDHAYQLSALTSAFNASLSQVEKMQDPVTVYNQLNELMGTMFRDVISKMSINIDRIRRDMGNKNPELTTQINANFERMLKDISPDTQEAYDNLQSELKKILGIRKGTKNNKKDSDK